MISPHYFVLRDLPRALEAYASIAWGADVPGGRAHLQSALEDVAGQSVEVMTTPWVSVSHTRGGGGFVIDPEKSVSVGFDLERIGRVREEVWARVATSAEVARFSGIDPTWLWAAKEAAYKSLRRDQQPAALSGVVLRAGTLALDEFAFEFEGRRDAGGEVRGGVGICRCDSANGWVLTAACSVSK